MLNETGISKELELLADLVSDMAIVWV